ncbi:MAG: ThiF family adenylyltransferase [Thermofilaceae archaeon]
MIREIFIEREQYIALLDAIREPERIAIVFGDVMDERAIVLKLFVPRDEDYLERSLSHALLKPGVFAREYLQVREEGLEPVAIIHSHLGSSRPSFGDVTTHVDVVKEYNYCLLGVYGLDEADLTFYDFSSSEPSRVKVKVVDVARFDRQIRVLGLRGQMRLAASRVLIVGVGGASLLAQALAASGVGKLILVDPDVWEYHNRNRVFIPRDLIGWNKAEALRLTIMNLFPDTTVEAYPCKAEELPLEVFRQADVIVCGADRLTARRYTNRVALELGKPAIFLSAGAEMLEDEYFVRGSVQVVLPGVTACYECLPIDYERLWLEEQVERVGEKNVMEYLRVHDPSSINLLKKLRWVTPSFIYLNMIVCGLAQLEIQKILTKSGGDPVKGLISYDPLSQTLRVYTLERNPECPACSKLGAIEDGQSR